MNVYLSVFLYAFNGSITRLMVLVPSRYQGAGSAQRSSRGLPQRRLLIPTVLLCMLCMIVCSYVGRFTVFDKQLYIRFEMRNAAEFVLPLKYIE